MKELSKILKVVLAKNKISWISKGALINSIVNNFLKEKWFNYSVKWKLQFSTYIIVVNNSSLASFLFINKKLLLDKINKRLQNMDYGLINNIKILCN